METCDIKVNDVDAFDRAVHGDDRIRSLPSGDDLAIITKDGGMAPSADGQRRACAVITWSCQVDGKIVRAQYTVPVRLLKFVLRALDAGYTDDGLPIPGTWGR